MLAVLRDLGLEKYIEKNANPPEAADKANPTQDEIGRASCRERVSVKV